VKAETQAGIRALLCAGIVFTAFSIYKVGVDPIRLAKPQMIVDIPIMEKAAGEEWRVLADEGGKVGRFVSSGRSVTLYRRASRDMKAVTIKITPVKARGAMYYGVREIAGEIIPSKEMKGGSVARIGKDEGLKTTRSNGDQRFATCLIGGVGIVAPEDMVKQKLVTSKKRTFREQALMLMGIEQPHNWECLFVDLQTATKGRTEGVLSQEWNRFRQVLKRAGK
jgi:hypothetical protein